MPESDRKLRETAMNLLARREHARQELIQKLQQRGYDVDSIVPVLDDFRDRNLQSDARFTESYCRVKIRAGFGPNRLKAELQSKGVSEDLISDALSEVCEETWCAMAQQAREKRFGALPPDELKARAKQQRFLQYRGFTQSQIKASFKQTEYPDPSNLPF